MKFRLLLLLLLTCSGLLFAQSSQVYSTPGTYTWTVPPCVTQITVQVWGGGGGGGSVWTRFDPTTNGPTSNEACVTAGGGGGGGFAQRTYTVVPGQVYTIVVGAGGAGGPLNNSGNNRANAGLPGGNSTFSGPATAGPGTLTGLGGGGGGAANFLRSCLGGCSGATHQGSNGSGGSGSGGLNGTLSYTGGNGSAGVHAGNTQDRSGSGGGGAGSTGNGGNANSTNGGSGGPGGGGNGGNGIVQPFGNGFLGTNGNPGQVIGGGGGGATGHNRSSNNSSHYTRTGGVGARGEVRILYTTPTLPEPTFTQVAPICSGGTLSPLPTTSNNGFSGTWSPALNTTATTTYIFTPDPSGPCADQASMTIVVNPATVPSFNPVGPICSGSSLSPLPTSSSNGITGVWSPALNTTQTTTYTFTPNAGQCATSANLTINVNQVPVIAAQPQNTGICANGTSTLTVNATSGPYQWQYFNGTSWVNVSNGTPANFIYLDPTSATLGIVAANATCDAPAEFRVVVGNPGCDVISQSASVTVIRASRIAPTGPQCSGTELNFEACPSAGVFNWQVSPQGSSSANPQSGSGSSFSFVPVNETGANVTFPVTVTMDYLGIQCVQNFNPTIVSPPDAGSDGTLTICQGGNPIESELFEALNGTPDPGGVWTNIGNVYTYTVNAVSPCSPASANVTISTEEVQPTFASVAPICEGENLNPLPTTSTNGVTGTWSPALNNMATTTYTFTPDGGQCALSASLTIEVTPPTAVPLFNAVGPVCSGELLNPLPAVSNNGVSGSWSPLVDNTQTTNYTFTPNSGQCAASVSLTIVVDQPEVPTFTPVGPYCSGDQVPSLPLDSNNMISGAWSPAIDNTSTANYTFVPSPGQCATNATMTITVSAPVTPTFDQIPAVCSGTAIDPLPSSSLEGISGNWSPAFDNQSTTNYTFQPDAGQCAQSATLSVTVNDVLVPQFQPVSPICSGDNLSPLPVVSDNGVSGAWSPVLNTTQTTTYTFTPNSGQCATTNDLIITVNSPASLPVFQPLGDLCVGSPAPVLSSVSENGISGTWSSPVSTDVPGTTTYIFTPDPEECGVEASLPVTVIDPVTPTFDPIGSLCQTASAALLNTVSANGITGLWSGAVSTSNPGTQTLTFTPLSGSCALPLDISYIVHPLPLLNAGNDLEVCLGESVTLSAQGAATYTWNNAVVDGVPFNPPIGISVYTVSGTDSNGCSGTDQVTLVVNPLPTVSAGSDQLVCEGTNVLLSGSGAVNYSWSNNVVNNVSFSAPVGTTIYTVSGTDANGCSDEDEVSVTVIPSPVPTFTFDGQGCVPLSVTLLNTTPGAQNCQWSISNGVEITGCSGVDVLLTQPGCYDVTLTTTASGCTSTFTAFDLICAEASPVADFSFQPQTINTIDTEVLFENLSSGATTYQWNFGDGTGVSEEVDPVHVFPTDGSVSYEVILVAYSPLGCSDTAVAYVNVEEELIFYVPNTFTPDGDAYNQVFKPVFTSGFDPFNYRLMIFNRWGELIFESNNAELGWDGSYGSKGQILMCQDGTYTWKIEFKQSGNDGKRSVTGHVNLLR